MVFEKLEKRLIFSGELEAATPIHIGSGEREVEIGEAIPILRDVDGQPYIPGSSLKGRTRAEAERIARKEGKKVCMPPAIDRMCGSTEGSLDAFCICCRMFGTAGKISLASKVKFRDAYPIRKIERDLIRPGIAIDRVTGTVAKGALYSVEAVPAGSKFNLEIVAENLADDELKLLLAALKSVEDSAIGGSSTRGFGKVKLALNKVQTRVAKYYLGEEEEKVLEGEELKQWIRTGGVS